MSNDARFDINITLRDLSGQWPGHLMGNPYAGNEFPNDELSGHDEFDLDVRYGETMGDPPVQEPLLGLSGPFGITCSNTCGVLTGCNTGCNSTCANTCGVLSGCAQSGCGGITCTCTCGASCGATCGNTCGLSCGGGCNWGDDDDDDDDS